jgi:hypothetical protein
MKTTMTTAEFEKMPIYRFRRYELAASCVDHAVKPMMILLGDDERYWVVTLANAERLLRAGYEVAPQLR